MRILVLFAHPVETSFGAALHAKAVETLRGRGHEVDDCDLNAEGFDPVMTRQDRAEYYDLSVNRRRVAPYVDRLLAAEALVFSFPVWNMGFPAVLKGFVDKVFLPGVCFEIRENGDYVPRLFNIKRLGVVCRLWRLAMEDFSRRRSAAPFPQTDRCGSTARRARASTIFLITTWITHERIAAQSSSGRSRRRFRPGDGRRRDGRGVVERPRDRNRNRAAVSLLATQLLRLPQVGGRCRGASKPR